ncbi:MAG TPA: hypothetical protein VH234_03675 [Candidatus Saccharimonadales bacterium]|jgi:hypothetical protein|nr:hypothetical protein [Candidatus Saccharimonadales bacterium]
MGETVEELRARASTLRSESRFLRLSGASALGVTIGITGHCIVSRNFNGLIVAATH